MTITLPPELEKTIAERARQQGVTSAEMAIELLHQSLQIPDRPMIETKQSAQDGALAAIRSGKYAHLHKPDSQLASDRFSAEKANELALEERRWQA